MMKRVLTEEPSFLFGALRLVQHHNLGLIANVPVPVTLIFMLTLTALGCVIVLLRRAWMMQEAGKMFVLTLLLAGALGNFFDRVTYGFVFDWILLFGRSIINLADVFIVVGILWYIVLTKRVNRG